MCSDALKRDGDALAHADAHRRQCTTSTGQRQLQSRGAGDPSTRHAKRMAERNGTTVRIDEVGILGNAELAQDRDALRRKGFVQPAPAGLNRPAEMSFS